MIKLGSNSISKIYLGSNSIGKAYLGSNLVFQKGSSPSPSQMVSYIRGGNGSYIDTGIKPDNTTRVVVWARNFNPGGAGYTWLFGCRTSYDTSGMFGVALAANDISGKALCANGGSAYSSVGFFNYVSNYHKYELNSNGLYVDDTQVYALSAATFSGGQNIYLYNDNDGGTPEETSLMPIDIAACKIYKNDVLVRDYTPVNSPSVGMYDAVSSTVFTNAGSGSFTYASFNPNAYTPLEYITANGSSYFMTDVIGNYSLSCVTKFKPTGTSNSYFDIFGVRDATNRCQFFVGNESYSCSRLSANLGTSVSTSDFYSSNTAGYVRNKEFVAIKTNNSFSAYYNNSQVGNTYTSSAGSSFTTNGYVCVCASYYMHQQSYEHGFVGNIYYISLNNNNYVPAKVGGVAGMYDTYNDIFKPSITETAFTAGPEL